MILALRGISAVTSLHFNILIHPGTRHPTWLFLWSPQCWQQSGWLECSERQPWPRGSLSICSNKPHPWLTLTPSPTSSGSYDNSLLTIHLFHSFVLRAAGSPRTDTDTSLPSQAGTLELRGLPVLLSPPQRASSLLSSCGEQACIFHFESSPLLPSSALLPSIHLFSWCFSLKYWPSHRHNQQNPSSHQAYMNHSLIH